MTIHQFPAPAKFNLDRPFYIVMCDYGTKGFESVVDPTETRDDIIKNIADGQYGKIVEIIEVIPGEHSSRSIIEDLLSDVGLYIETNDVEPTREVRDLIEHHCGLNTVLRAVNFEMSRA